MTRQKKIHWAIIFALLISFTASAVYSLSGVSTTLVALAAVPADDNGVVVVSGKPLSESERLKLVSANPRVALYFCADEWFETHLLNGQSYNVADQGFAVIKSADLPNAGLPGDVDCRQVSRSFHVPLLPILHVS